MAVSLDTTFVVDLLLIFVTLFLLLISASVVGASREEKIGPFMKRHGLDSAGRREIRLWRLASGFGVAVFLVVATMFVAVFAMPSGVAALSLESILLSTSLYVSAILFLTLYRFFGCVTRVLEGSTLRPT